MGKRAVRIIFLIFGLLLVIYLAIPEPNFPNPLPNSLISQEPADLEDPMRRGYYTDLTREEIINYYKEQFYRGSSGIALPFVRLNYPPEEAQQIIRDQTLSTFLEEIVHPGRESLFINGFKPDTSKMNPLIVNGRTWERKVIVKYVTSSTPTRVFISLTSLIVFYWVVLEWGELARVMYKIVGRRK